MKNTIQVAPGFGNLDHPEVLAAVADNSLPFSGRKVELVSLTKRIDEGHHRLALDLRIDGQLMFISCLTEDKFTIENWESPDFVKRLEAVTEGLCHVITQSDHPLRISPKFKH